MVVDKTGLILVVAISASAVEADRILAAYITDRPTTPHMADCGSSHSQRITRGRQARVLGNHPRAIRHSALSELSFLSRALTYDTTRRTRSMVNSADGGHVASVAPCAAY